MKIKDINPDTLKEVDNDELLSLHFRLHQLYGRFFAEEVEEPKEDGEGLSKEDLLNAGVFIVQEMTKRGLKHNIVDEFDKLIAQWSVKDVLPHLDMVAYLKDFIVIHDWLSLTGSSVRNNIPNDYDVVVRQEDYDPSIILKLREMLPEEIFKKVHPIFNPVGATFDFLPLFDLKAVLKPELRIQMILDDVCKRGKIKLMEPFTPLKTAGGYGKLEFFDLEALYDFWAAGFIPEKSIAAEEKFDGIRFQIHKKGNKVKIFTEDKKLDRVKYFPETVKELLAIPIDNFILDAEMVEWTENFRFPKPRREMIHFVTAVEVRGDRWVRFNVFDSLYLEDEAQDQEQWDERQKILKTILPKDTVHLHRVIPEIAKTEKEFKDAVDKVRKIKGSEGAMLKVTDSKYPLTGSTAEWAKIKNVKEVKVKVIGKFRKALPWKSIQAEAPKEDLTGDKALEAYKKLRKESHTFIYRCAFSLDRKLQPVEAEKAVTPGDLEIKWDGEKQEWKGHDDPQLWTMGLGFSNRKRGELSFANTYATGIDAKIGDVITVAPILVRKWKVDKEDHYSWTFPTVRNLEEVGVKPFDKEEIERIVRATAKPGELLKQAGEEIHEEEERPTREEQIEESIERYGDWYMIKQQEGKSYPFVIQIHYRGLWSDGQRKEILKRLDKVKGNREEQKKIWKEFKLQTLIEPIDDLKRAVERVTEAGGNVSARINKSLSKDFPAKFDISKIVNRGNAHLDWRFQRPPELGDLFGWTLDTPGSVLQFLEDGKLISVQREKVMEHKVKDNIVCQKKAIQPLAWYKLVDWDNPVFKVEVGEVGGTLRTAGEFHLQDKGEHVAGVQKTDYHEYFCFFEKNIDLSGRWGFQLIKGREEYERAPAKQFWMANRPEEQRPYILTHDKEKEEAKAKKDKIEMIWNDETIPSLEKLDYPYLEEGEKARGRGMGVGNPAQQDGGTGICVCPQCGLEIEHERGIPCLQIECPKCGVSMIGKAEKFFKIYKKDKKRQIVFGIVLEPNTVDTQSEWETALEIEKAAHRFMEKSQTIGVMHKDTKREINLIENYIAPAEFEMEGQRVKKGSWVMGIHVLDKEIWKQVEEGQLNGFSIAGFARGFRPDGKEVIPER